MQKYLNKTTIIIAAAVILLIGGAVFFFGRKTPLNIVGFQDQFPTSASKTPSSTDTASQTGGGTNGSGIAPVSNIQNADSSALSADQVARFPIGTQIKLTDDRIVSLSSADTGLIRFHKNIPEALGHLFERKADGTNQETKISNFTVAQIMKVVWAPGGTTAVVFYNSAGIIRKLLIDYKATSTPKTTFLPDTISDVAFSPNGKSMAFINNLGTTRNIFTATADYKNQKKILDNILPDLELSWPGTSLLAVKTKSSYASRGYLYTFTPAGGSFSKVAEGFGLDAAWNKDGTGVIVSTVSGGGQIQPLKYIDIKSSAEKELELLTIAEKCVFPSNLKTYAYCAAPMNVPSVKYPDTWWQGAVSFRDNIFSINTSDGKTTNIAASSADIIRPIILSDDSFIAFQDKTTGFLWSMKLK
ncbi:hypothetical protein A3C73_02285 [Candidatus Giovannonibacteria bacterium RIFCSPHIGHO2_02_FULL_44_11]|nr:MAG: hypothetical protein A3C73_02285 [Candidatus Giovannonibacteria bacterium RIFCSPHIGHO2_02_FULL_44_11]